MSLLFPFSGITSEALLYEKKKKSSGILCLETLAVMRGSVAHDSSVNLEMLMNGSQ